MVSTSKEGLMEAAEARKGQKMVSTGREHWAHVGKVIPPRDVVDKHGTKSMSIEVQIGKDRGQKSNEKRCKDARDKICS